MDNEIMTLDEILQDPYYLKQYEQRIKAMTDGSLKAEKPTGEKMEVNNMDEQTTQTTPVQAVPTPTTAVSVDTEAITKAAAEKATEAAEKKMEAVFKSMLQQQGLDAETISKMTAEWKSNQVTPEQALEAEKNKTAAAEARAAAAEEKGIALAKGIPLATDDEATKAKVAACMTLAKSYVTADVTFEAALDKALQIISFAPAAPEKPEAKPPMWGGTGTKQVTSTMDAEKQRILDAAKSAMRIK